MKTQVKPGAGLMVEPLPGMPKALALIANTGWAEPEKKH